MEVEKEALVPKEMQQKPELHHGSRARNYDRSI